MIAISWRPRLIVAGLLLALTYLWLQSASPELERRNRLQTTLRIIELRDAELMRDILLARAGLLANYDALTQAGQELLRLSQSLQTELQAVEAAEQSLGNLADQLTATVQERLGQIEYLKSDNALLRNSVMSFDEIGKTLRAAAKPGDAVKLGNLWRLMFSFMDSPQPELAVEIQQELDRLAGLAAQSDDYRVLIAHGRLIIEVSPKVDTLLRQIIAQPIVSRVDDLQQALRQYSGSVEQQAEAYRLALYLVAVVLLAYLLYQFVLLRANTLALRKAHANLQQETNERLQAESWLRESEARLRAITDSAHEAIVSVDMQGNIVSWNQGAQLMFGFPADQVLGQPFQQLLANPAPDFFAQIQEVQGANRLSSPMRELKALRRNNSVFPVELSLSSWTRGAERYLTAIIRDISVRKQLEQVARQQELQLIQANKMTALGTLVSGVAHEINNPNQLILFNSGLLADIWSDALEVLEEHYQAAGEFSLGGLPYSEMRNSAAVLIRDVRDGAKRIERIVAELKNYARPPSSEAPVSFAINEVVERAAGLLKHLLDQKTRHFKTDLAEGLPELRGNPQQVEQVLVNLLINALEALPDPEKSVSVTTKLMNDGRQLSVEVRDEGVGIAAEHIEQLCDPFFTTKQANGGTGLGLAISASLLRAQGGSLSFSSAPGQGTCARVIFQVNLGPAMADNHAM
ncbi:DAHL domain-containing protein [Methylomonas sp. OY6]|uniref:histidine kinase n=1 Tax=Methylomonas defluvii TaxID=3045149 RepID=A0ABU4UKY8_9GAMM|nr:DAHL domain-containing protein [Methylomonas sp. OY6]MDX8130160.1 DAHL domain-containing protein [Methylomonas sp. OY6]